MGVSIDAARKYVEQYGDKEGPIVGILTHQVVQLVQEWRLFLYFYCCDKERVDVLNEASPSTNRILANVLWDSTILKIRYLSENHETGKKGSNKNASLEHLVMISETKQGSGMRMCWDTLKVACKTSREYASKHLAHKDLPHALGEEMSPTNRAETTRAVKAIARFVWEFHGQINNTDLCFIPITGSADAQQFLWSLHLGNERRAGLDEEWKARGLAGENPDLKGYLPPEWLTRIDPLGGLFDS